MDLGVVCYSEVEEEGHHELGVTAVPAFGELFWGERGIALQETLVDWHDGCSRLDLSRGMINVGRQILRLRVCSIEYGV